MHVNQRFKVLKSHAKAFIINIMDKKPPREIGRIRAEETRARILAAIDSFVESSPSKIAIRKISLDAGMGPNYISQMKNGEKLPKLDAIYAICDVIGVHPFSVLINVDFDSETMEVLEYFAGKPASFQKAFKAVLDGQGL